MPTLILNLQSNMFKLYNLLTLLHSLLHVLLLLGVEHRDGLLVEPVQQALERPRGVVPLLLLLVLRGAPVHLREEPDDQGLAGSGL